GYLAGFLVRGDEGLGVIGHIVLGIVGALVGGFLGGALLGGNPLGGPFDISSIVASVIGAIIVVLVAHAVMGSSRRSTVRPARGRAGPEPHHRDAHRQTRWASACPPENHPSITRKERSCPRSN